ncbi:MAG: hypothetical protein HQ504_03645 [Rhodospirillaceae bacterium]|nr:hypothetical protein [Rhodospirillaceae bacterium]
MQAVIYEWVIRGAIALGSGAFILIIRILYERRTTRHVEIRERVNKLESLIREYEEKACWYWNWKHEEKDSIQLGSEIKRIRQQIGMELSIINRRISKKCSGCNILLFKLHKTATEHPFESVQYEPDPVRTESIQNTANLLIIELRASLNIV